MEFFSSTLAPQKCLKDILADTKASQQNTKMKKDDDDTTLQQALRSSHFHLTTMEQKIATTDQVHRSCQATKSRTTATCRNLRRKQLRLAERQRKSEFIQSQIQLFPFEGKKKPITLKKKYSKSKTPMLARDKATAVSHSSFIFKERILLFHVTHSNCSFSAIRSRRNLIISTKVISKVFGICVWLILT
jgi:hypothetical protein